jgi:hypothetical protein
MKPLKKESTNMHNMMDMNNSNVKNAMIIGTIGIGAIAGYSMLRHAKNSRKPLNRAKNMLSKANMFN